MPKTGLGYTTVYNQWHPNAGMVPVEVEGNSFGAYALELIEVPRDPLPCGRRFSAMGTKYEKHFCTRKAGHKGECQGVPMGPCEMKRPGDRHSCLLHDTHDGPCTWEPYWKDDPVIAQLEKSRENNS